MNFENYEILQEVSPKFKERASQIPIDAIELPTRAHNVLIQSGNPPKYKRF